MESRTRSIFFYFSPCSSRRTAYTSAEHALAFSLFVFWIHDRLTTFARESNVRSRTLGLANCPGVFLCRTENGAGPFYSQAFERACSRTHVTALMPDQTDLVSWQRRCGPERQEPLARNDKFNWQYGCQRPQSHDFHNCIMGIGFHHNLRRNILVLEILVHHSPQCEISAQ